MTPDRSHHRRRLRLCGTVVCAAVVLASSLHQCHAASDDEIIARVTEAWRARLDAVKRVRYHLSGDATFLAGKVVPIGDPELPADAAAKGLPEADSIQPLHAVWLFDFQKACCGRSRATGPMPMPCVRFDR